MVRIIRIRSQSVLVGMVLWEEVRRKRSQALIPSLCGILVYNDEIRKAREAFLIQKGRTIDPDGLNIREETY